MLHGTTVALRKAVTDTENGSMRYTQQPAMQDENCAFSPGAKLENPCIDQTIILPDPRYSS